MKKEQIYFHALNHYGLNAQIDMVFEEFAELQKELCKFKRGRSNYPEIAEELADCFIMLEQMEQFFNLKKVVTDIRCRKLHRLEERLSGGIIPEMMKETEDGDHERIRGADDGNSGADEHCGGDAAAEAPGKD